MRAECGPVGRVVAALAAGLALHIVLHADALEQTWTTGAFLDSDDAMRMVQIRDWTAGQSWFDLVQYRLGPPDGLAMHWSRLVDAGVRSVRDIAGLLLDLTTAERAARILWPLLLFLGLLAALIALTRDLFGRPLVWPIVLLASVAAYVTGQFAPGRIDHHNVQILLAVLTVLATIRAPFSRWAGAAAGLGAAVLLTVGFEAIAVVGVCGCALTLRWVATGPEARGALRSFSGALASATVVLFLATVPHRDWGVRACDAASIVLVVLTCAVAGATWLVTMRCWSGPLARAGVAVLAFGTAAGITLLYAPECAGGPYGRIAPDLRQLWLDGVREAQGFLVHAARDPGLGIAIGGVLVTGWCGLALGFAQAHQRRHAWAVVAAAAAVSLLLTVVQIRFLAYAVVFVLPGFLALLTAAAAIQRRPVRLAATAGAILAATPQPWALAGLLIGGPIPSSPGKDCMAPDAMTTLATEPPGLVLTSIDLGSFVLAHTSHAVGTGPYHRHQDGMREVLGLLTGSPAASLDRARTRGFTLIVLCREMTDVADLVTAAPDGLAAQLLAGRAFDGLERRMTAGPLAIWRLRP